MNMQRFDMCRSPDDIGFLIVRQAHGGLVPIGKPMDEAEGRKIVEAMNRLLDDSARALRDLKETVIEALESAE